MERSIIPRLVCDGVESDVESWTLESTEIGIGVERVGSMVVRRGIARGMLDWGDLNVDDALERDGDEDTDRPRVSRGGIEAGENDDGGEESVLESTGEDLRPVVLGEGEAGGLW